MRRRQKRDQFYVTCTRRLFVHINIWVSCVHTFALYKKMCVHWETVSHREGTRWLMHVFIRLARVCLLVQEKVKSWSKSVSCAKCDFAKIALNTQKKRENKIPRSHFSSSEVVKRVYTTVACIQIRKLEKNHLLGCVHTRLLKYSSQ